MGAVNLDIPTLIFFILPGAVILLLKSRFGEGREVAWTNILVLSAVYHIFSAWILTPGEFDIRNFDFNSSDRSFLYFTLRTLAVLFVIGLAWGLLSSYSDDDERGLWVRLLEAAGIRKYAKLHTAWHRIFGRALAAKMRVTLEDGTYIVGWYTGSAVVSDSSPHDVYICQDFEQTSVRGWWIPRSRIQSIEILELSDDELKRSQDT